MRICSARRTLSAMAGSLTRRQLLARGGGATVALACLGSLPAGAAADPAALSSARATTYAAILDAIDTHPGYELGDRVFRVRRFADLYRESGDEFRAYADDVLDALGTPVALDRLSAGALDLATLPYLEPDSTSTIVFSV